MNKSRIVWFWSDCFKDVLYDHYLNIFWLPIEFFLIVSINVFLPRSSSINASSYTSIARSFQCLSSSTCMWTKNRHFLLFFYVYNSLQKEKYQSESPSIQIHMHIETFYLTSCVVDVLNEFHNHMHNDRDLKFKNKSS